MTIYMILEEIRTGEDHSGRDLYEFKVNADEDGNYGPGYFTSRQAANKWIGEQVEAAEAKYDEARLRYTELLEEYVTRSTEFNRILARAQEDAAGSGLTLHAHAGSSVQRPLEPRRERTNYEVIEISPEVGQ